MDTDLDTLATALDVRADEELMMRPELRPERPRVGIAPKLSDAELCTVAVIQELLGFSSEMRFVRDARCHLAHLFSYLPKQSGYNKRLRAAGAQLYALIRLLGRESGHFSDDTWMVDSTPVECGRSRDTAKRSDLVGTAAYGDCPSHSRWFWGLRLHLVCTPSGLPISFALTGAEMMTRCTSTTSRRSPPYRAAL